MATASELEPPSYKETMSNPDATEWYKAMEDEYNSLMSNKVWKLVDRPKDSNILKQFLTETLPDVKASLPFLDVRVKVKPNGSLSRCVYRKLTHADRYLHASSHHHPRHLQSVVTSLKNRAQDLCDPEHFEQELDHVQEVLANNGNQVNKQTRQPTKRRKHPEVKRQPAYMPYARGVTDKIGGLLKKYSISTVLTPGAKVTNIVGTPKDVLPLQTPGVYKINCSCGSSYIGQTKRKIAERVKEYIAAVKTDKQINQP
ncbi:uncharacterized protein LOC123664651 [Melitaea cinxia]|uniref:uncharacterized protein LOC123664651 n=1 Tax=Melitaea cinxia TaxID=113334 RepID=UPI001E270A33|nr:uncharacterized protein LOC123664651 [Melitaea cinxia]